MCRGGGRGGAGGELPPQYSSRGALPPPNKIEAVSMGSVLLLLLHALTLDAFIV